MSTEVTGTLTIAGVEYPLEILTAFDWTSLVDWVADRMVQSVKRNLADLPDAQAVEVLKDVFRRAGSLTRQSPEVEAALKTPEGSARILWLSVRHKNPAVTLEQVQDAQFPARQE